MNDNFNNSDELKEFLNLSGIKPQIINDSFLITNEKYDYSLEPKGNFSGEIKNLKSGQETYVSNLSFRILPNDTLVLNGHGLGQETASASKNINIIKELDCLYVRFIYPQPIEKQTISRSDHVMEITSISGEYYLVEVPVF
jgi:hypothetical protein